MRLVGNGNCDGPVGLQLSIRENPMATMINGYGD